MGRRRQEVRFRDLAKAVACECMPGIVRKVMREVVHEEVGAAADRIIDALRPKDVRPWYEVSQQQAEKWTGQAVDFAGLPARCKISVKTFWRMENNLTAPRSDYSVSVRLTKKAFFAWLVVYIRDEKLRLDPNHAVSYDEELLEHQILC